MAPAGTRRLSREEEDRLFAGAEEATRFFMGKSDVQHALEKIARLLEEDGIPYAIVGAMALNAYGYRRLTANLDVLLNPEGFEKLNAKGLPDTENGVPIHFILTGEY